MTPVEFGPRSSPGMNRVVGDFVSSEIWGQPGRIENYCSIGVFDGVQLVAGVLYHNHYSDTGVIEMTSASVDKRWLTRPVLKAMFALPFDRFGCQMVVLRVSEFNKPMLRIAKAYGFKLVTIPRLRGRAEAEVICTLTDDTWRESRFHRRNML